MPSETEEDLKARHSQEKKDLVAQVTSLKRSFNKNDSKRKKEVQAQVQKLENDLKVRHERELNDLVSQTSTLKITEDKPVPQNEVKSEDGGEKKRTKAQKNREKKEEKDRRMREAMKQDALNAATGKGALESEKIRSILEERGLKLVDILPDGDCMYNALADQLSIQDPASTITGEGVRELTANHLIANKDTFLPFLGNGDLDDEGFEDYCNKVRNPCRDGGEWGGSPELQAISTALEKPVEVLHADGAPHCFGENFAGPPLVLTYHRYAYTLGEHYNSTAKA
ncbi:unnamed protein product [Bursaphelenchus xylophilus]|uniref:(pine wood nematode) hypothetical protein n=1 Tax=Bursaphelenchus xylophilus TaxID=6326 RepID=A0A1I7SM27_BURXY|nr:unnamed protein product [Bursaphelenchus xylophilus]CAG9129975.1 unnamed protein product [Bursaphelenchus xylophilus]